MRYFLIRRFFTERINANTAKIWPVDGKRSAQFEHTLLVTETGCDILTARGSGRPWFMDQLEDSYTSQFVAHVHMLKLRPFTLEFHRVVEKSEFSLLNRGNFGSSSELEDKSLERVLDVFKVDTDRLEVQQTLLLGEVGPHL
uniref:Methionine aminopeptidase n=1 Tax=Parascaris equorum TaxID=6256 RepID=A0A914RKF4_PAREQ